MKTPRIEKSLFGHMPDGREVASYTLFDEKGQSIVLTEYACAIVEINVLDKDGKLRDVALGYDHLEDYLADTRSFGAIIGRYANRIAKGMFTLNGVTYHLARNDGENSLHGGIQSFKKKLFSSEVKDGAVVFTYTSPDLEEGYPGNFTLKETASFSGGVFRMQFDYVCDKDTVANITNHNYFNLNGHGHGTILNHKVMIHADRFCRGDDGLLAQAPAVPVDGTPFDLRKPKTILEGLSSYSQDIIGARGGYDHCFEIANHDGPDAAVVGDESGIRLEVYSDMPALQFYTGNMLGGHVRGKKGAFYNTFEGFALESQQFPNAVNEPRFPSAVIKANEPASAFIEYRFGQTSQLTHS